MKIKLVPSIMCADFTDLENDIKEMEKAKVDYLHFDIMDGHFVPNFTMGVDIIRSIRKITDIPFDTHLMIYNSERFIEQFARAGSDIISVHPESSLHIQKSLSMIKKLGVKPAIALNPETPLSILDYIIDDVEMILVMTVNPGFAGQRVIPSTIKKIKDLRNKLKGYGLEIDVEVDGNVSFKNAPKMVKAGANVLVLGTSSIFREDISIQKGIEEMRRKIIKI